MKPVTSPEREGADLRDRVQAIAWYVVGLILLVLLLLILSSVDRLEDLLDRLDALEAPALTSTHLKKDTP